MQHTNNDTEQTIDLPNESWDGRYSNDIYQNIRIGEETYRGGARDEGNFRFGGNNGTFSMASGSTFSGEFPLVQEHVYCFIDHAPQSNVEDTEFFESFLSDVMGHYNGVTGNTNEECGGFLWAEHAQ